MRIAVLGTGMVGQTIGSKLVELGHEVRMGSRTAGGEKAAAWVAAAGERASEGTFEDAAAFGELVFNCTAGTGTLAALEQAGAANLAGKVLVDVANPLDFSTGELRLAVCNEDSLGEQVQRAHPDAKVVKALNTMNCEVMVDPTRVSGDHLAYVCGEDADAKEQVRSLLGEFGWPGERVLDLGGIRAARGVEMFLPFWLELMRAQGTANFNLAIQR
jgi:predicted dinucleotide-binding enzyme